MTHEPGEADRLDDLLFAWQQEFSERGRDVAAEELCRDCPELAVELARRIRAVRLIEGLRDGDGDTDAGATQSWPTTGAAGVPVPQGYEMLDGPWEGGMGIVIKARRLALGRVEAVKMIKAREFAGLKELARFRFEAEAAAGLDHPNIVSVYNVGEVGGLPYLALRRVDGQSLADRLRAGPLSSAAAAAVVEKVAWAVHFAHQRGILHRDLKPANILVDQAGEPFVTDFGVARRLDGRGAFTEAGAVVGSARYMAPEQARADPNLTVAADVYALGAVLYEALTGSPPFTGANRYEVLRRVLDIEPQPPRAVCPAVDASLEAICLKCLEKAPADRYASAADLADDLTRFRRGEAVSAQPPGFWDWLRQLLRTRPEPNPDYSWPVTIWFGAIELATSAAIFALVQADGSAAAVWGTNLAAGTAVVAVLWWYMLRRFRRLPPTERHSLVIAFGHTAALLALTAAYVPLSISAPARTALAAYPALAAVAGLALFTLGSTNWSRFLLIGLGMIALSPLLAHWPQPAPLVYGAAKAGVLWWWSYGKKVTHSGPPEGAAP